MARVRREEAQSMESRRLQLIRDMPDVVPRDPLTIAPAELPQRMTPMLLRTTRPGERKAGPEELRLPDEAKRARLESTVLDGRPVPSMPAGSRSPLTSSVEPVAVLNRRLVYGKLM